MPYTPKQRAILAIVPALAATLIRLLGMTLRFENRVAPGATPAEQIQGAAICVFWHRALLASAYRYRNLDIAILISRSFDGELIARTVERLGFRAIRGSSTRGGPAGLRQLERAFQQGHICAITADGPKGPAQIAKPGPAQLATLTAAPLRAFYLEAESAWQLKTWDRFVIPKPFSRVVCAWAPIVLSEEQAIQTAIQSALDQSVAMAQAANVI